MNFDLVKTINEYKLSFTVPNAEFGYKSILDELDLVFCNIWLRLWMSHQLCCCLLSALRIVLTGLVISDSYQWIKKRGHFYFVILHDKRRVDMMRSEKSETVKYFQCTSVVCPCVHPRLNYYNVFTVVRHIR